MDINNSKKESDETGIYRYQYEANYREVSIDECSYVKYIFEKYIGT